MFIIYKSSVRSVCGGKYSDISVSGSYASKELTALDGLCNLTLWFSTNGWFGIKIDDVSTDTVFVNSPTE